MDKFVLGLIVGMMIILGVLALPNSKISKFDNAIAQCERENALTENQKCVITAKVVDKDA